MRFAVCSFALLIILPAAQSRACSCPVPDSPQESLKQATAVFVAKVTAIENGESGRMVTMEISTTWKGTTDKVVTLQTGFGGGDCGYVFAVGKSYLVYGHQGKLQDGSPGPLTTNICTRTRPLERAAGDIKALGPAKMPPV